MLGILHRMQTEKRAYINHVKADISLNQQP